MYKSTSLHTAANYCGSLVLVSLLAACGGGGSSNGDMSSTSNGNGTDASAVISGESTIQEGKKQRTREPVAVALAPEPALTTACSYADWRAGQYYSAGAVVRYPSNGKFYRAKYENPGYDPVISTWYWELITPTCTDSTAAPALAPESAPESSTTCSFPNWISGQSYVAGTIVRYAVSGNLYRATNDNPGYDPTISTWFWQLHTCSTTTTTTPTSTSSGFIVTEAQFNQMFPNRSSFYTYAGLVAATRAYPAIFNTGSDTVKRQEAAAFLANVHHETGGLQYIREINQANWSHYCQAGGQYPCAPGQQYYGRGPIQLSWNYNYGAAGQALGLNLLADPDMVARDATVAWQTAMWFWMTQSGGASTTPNRAMVNSIGFGETIRAINGGLECNKPAGSVGNQQMQTRVTYYRQFTQLLGVPTGSNLTC
jgi:predicted chitinase